MSFCCAYHRSIHIYFNRVTQVYEKRSQQSYADCKNAAWGSLGFKIPLPCSFQGDLSEKFTTWDYRQWIHTRRHIPTGQNCHPHRVPCRRNTIRGLLTLLTTLASTSRKIIQLSLKGTTTLLIASYRHFVTKMLKPSPASPSKLSQICRQTHRWYTKWRQT